MSRFSHSVSFITVSVWLTASACGSNSGAVRDPEPPPTAPAPITRPAAPVASPPAVADPVDAEPRAFGLPMAIDDPSGHALDHLHAALRRVERGEGQARLMFWGASHVAADFFTGYLRRKLQARFGDAGHGFILPAKPWRTYRHLGIKVSSSKGWRGVRVRANSTEIDDYGLAGVYVESDSRRDWGRVGTAKRGPVGHAAGLFDLYYLKQPGGGRFEVLVDGKRVRRVNTRAKTRSPGYVTVKVKDGAHSFEVRHRGHGLVRLFGVAVERERPGVIVDTLGIPGARARYHLLWGDSLYREHLWRRHPDLVVIAYGTNESGDDSPIADYEVKLREVVGRVRDTLPQASCLLIGPSDWPVTTEEGEYLKRERTAQLIEIQRRVSHELGCGFFDLVAFQGGFVTMPKLAAMDPPLASKDLIHYTRRGYLKLGEVLLGALMDGYEPAVSSALPAPLSHAADDHLAPTRAR